MDLSAGLKPSKDTTQLAGSALKKTALASFFIGVAAIALAFFVLYVNEGRVNPARLAGAAIPIEAAQEAGWGTEGQLVGISGTPTAAGQLGDGMFLKPGPYLEVKRDFEVYAWSESNAIETVTDENGESYLKRVFRYEKGWSYNPHDSLGFTEKEGHQNIKPHLDKGTYRPDEIVIGRYRVPAKNLVMPTGDELELTDDNIDLWNEKMQERLGTRVGNVIYLGNADPNNPQIGDVRIHYKFIPSDHPATIFGKLVGMTVEPFDGNSRGAFRLEWGGVDESVFAANRQFTRGVWVTRGVSFLMLLIGMLLVIGPVAARGRRGRAVVSVVLAALVMTAAWAVAYRLAYGPVTVAVGIGAAWGLAFVIGKKAKINK